MDDATSKRKERLKEVENQVNARLMEPWNDQLHDLILYAQMNRRGVRVTDIEHLIRAEVKRLSP